MQRTITVVKPLLPRLLTRKRVAAYVRVSSVKDAMLQSLSAQISYYNDYIQKNPAWIFAGVYADEGITGTKDSRAEFQRLLEDARAGKIDLVITKSISRFARNTVTLLETVRELKSMGVDVFFEKENIRSLSGDGELMLTILASYAQEESRSVSDNCKWRIRNRFRDGEPANLRFMYGYRIKKGEITIEPNEAAVVRMIFSDYIAGLGCGKIARKLRALAVKGIRGATWTPARIVAILKNEKYAGNALLQKRYVRDHLNKSLVRNDGALPMYFAEGSHAAIVEPDIFNQVQALVKKRQERVRNEMSTKTYLPFSGRIRCGYCGKKYKRITNHGRHAWNCTTYLVEGKAACPGLRIPEDTLLERSAQALGLIEFDADRFLDRVQELVAKAPNRITYCFQDGHTVETSFQHQPRGAGWSAEARQKARERMIEQRRKSK